MLLSVNIEQQRMMLVCFSFSLLSFTSSWYLESYPMNESEVLAAHDRDHGHVHRDALGRGASDPRRAVVVSVHALQLRARYQSVHVPHDNT